MVNLNPLRVGFGAVTFVLGVAYGAQDNLTAEAKSVFPLDVQAAFSSTTDQLMDQYSYESWQVVQDLLKQAEKERAQRYLAELRAVEASNKKPADWREHPESDEYKHHVADAEAFLKSARAQVKAIDDAQNEFIRLDMLLDEYARDHFSDLHDERGFTNELGFMLERRDRQIEAALLRMRIWKKISQIYARRRRQRIESLQQRLGCRNSRRPTP